MMRQLLSMVIGANSYNDARQRQQAQRHQQRAPVAAGQVEGHK